MRDLLRILLFAALFVLFVNYSYSQTVVYVPGNSSTLPNYPTVDLALTNSSNDLRIVLTSAVTTPANGFTFPSGHPDRKVEFYGSDTLTAIIDGSGLNGTSSMMGTGGPASVYNMNSRLGSIKFTNIKIINAHTNGNGSVLNTNTPVTITAINSVFDNNHSGVDGGIIYIRHDTNKSSSIIFNNSYLRNNAAARGGIGFLQIRGVRFNIEFDNCVIHNNSANGVYGDDAYGGGLISITPGNSMYGSNILINSSTIFNNSSLSDGGLFYIANQVDNADKNIIKILGSRIAGNKSRVNGGGFYTGRGNYDILVQNSNLDDNISETGSGGVFYIHRFTAANSSFLVDGSSFLRNKANLHGSVLYTGEFHNGSTFGIRNHSVFNTNVATTGSGGVFNITSVGDHVTFDWSDFIMNNNAAGEDGGVLYNGGSGVNFTFLSSNGTLQSNLAGIDEVFEPNNSYPKGNGGVMYVGMIGVNASFTFDNLALTSNEAQTGGGGVFYTDEVANSFKFNMTRLTVKNNWSGEHGGALNLGEVIGAFSNFTIKTSVFENNESRSQYGGGAIIAAKMLLGGGVQFNFEDLEFRDNRAEQRGGAICLAGYDDTNYFECRMKRVKFYDNIAVMSGGALYFTNGMIDMSEGMFENNRVESSASDGLGGGIYFDYTSATITNSSFINNYADNGGGIMHQRSRLASTRNTVFVNNESSISGIGGATYHSANSYSTEYFNCLFAGNTAGIFAGAIYQRAAGGIGNQPVPIVNCTFYNNFTTNNNNSQSNISAGAVFSHTASNVANCVFYNNSGPSVSNFKDLNMWVPASSTITTSSMQLANGTAYNNPALVGVNLFGNTNPGFMNASNVLGASGTGRGTDAGLRLTHPSMVNNGTNNVNSTVSDLSGAERFEGIIDMGAYEKVFVLPVTLVNFTVSRENEITHLAWSTTMETNSCCFEIQHSLDGKVWNTIGMVNAQNTSGGQHDYHFKSEVGLQGNSSHRVEYYRLKMLDNDGTFAYSAIRSFQTASELNVSFYPNPVAESLVFKALDMSTVVNVELINMSGVTVLRSLPPYINNSINVKAIIPGIYIVKLEQGNGHIITGRILVAK